MVQIFTKTCDAKKGSQAYLWSSVETSDAHRGTKIVVHLKDDDTGVAKLSTMKEAAQSSRLVPTSPFRCSRTESPQPINKQGGALDEVVGIGGGAHGHLQVHLLQLMRRALFHTNVPDCCASGNQELSLRPRPRPCTEQAPQQGARTSNAVGLYSRRVLVEKHADGVIPMSFARAFRQQVTGVFVPSSPCLRSTCTREPLFG